MTVSPILSQVVYTIDDKKFTCYTDWENREIAKLILNYDYCDSINSLLVIENTTLNNRIVIQNDRMNHMANYIDDLVYTADTLVILADEYKLDAKINKDKADRNNNRFITSLTVNGVLVLLLTIILL